MSSLKEETLCQKHKNFNKKVQNAVKENKVLKYCIVYEDTDLENLFRVENACHTRNIDFLLEVFKCEDMLFVSRAIRHSKWLVEPQYSYIVNPQYLYLELLPYMLTDAWNKLLYHIRINLKDPTRFEEFYNYLENKDIHAAIKWFPKCSIEFIVGKLRNNINIIPEHIVIRLFTSSFDVFKIYCHEKKDSLKLDKALFLIKTHADDFFDILDTLPYKKLPKFNKKMTKLIMKVCPHRLMLNFSRYENHIDIPCFFKYCLKQDSFDEIKSRYKTCEKLRKYFSEKREKEDEKFSYGEHIVTELDSCGSNNQSHIKDILTKFKENISQLSMDQKLKFINKFISKCQVHQFDSTMWSSYNDIFKEIMNMKQYSERNKTLQSYIKTVVFYKVIHNEVIPEENLSQFEFDGSLRIFQKKFSKEEKENIFDFLYNFAFRQLKILPNKTVWIDNIFVLFKCWNMSVQKYPLFNNEVAKVVQHLKSESNYKDLKNLYNTKKFWRRYLLNEKIVIEPISSKTFLNILKHNPDLLPLEKPEIGILETKLTTLFYRKLRTYWSPSLAQQFKDLFFTNLNESQSIGLYILLSREEYLNFIQSNAPNSLPNKLLSESQMKKTTIKMHIAKHMNKVYPKLPVEKTLLYYKSLARLNTLSSINSILQRMSIHQMSESLTSFDTWPELVQKLCIFIIFSQPHYYYKREIIFKIWEITKHPSVRAEIFKKSMKALFIYEKGILFNNTPMVHERWQFLQRLMDTLGKDELLMLYNLKKSFKKMPIMEASNFYLKSFQIMKSFPPKCGMFPRRPLMHYGQMHLIDYDILAAMVNDTITERLWTTKLNREHLDVVTSSCFIWKDNAEQIIAFRKIVAPLFERAYKIWDAKTINRQLVRYNINNIVALFNDKSESYLLLDSQSNLSPTVLLLLLDSLENNLSVKENYLMIRKSKLAVQYFRILSTVECKIHDFDIDVLKEESMSPLATKLVKIFCEDIATYGVSIWILFYHALQKMLDRFSIETRMQYKLFHLMLDESKYLTTEQDILIHILVFELLYKDNRLINFLLDIGIVDSDDSDADDEGKEILLCRVISNHSDELKAIYSKRVLSNVCRVYYQDFKYM